MQPHIHTVYSAQSIYTLSLARAKSESANDAKTGEQRVFGEIHTIHELGTAIRNLATPQIGLTNEEYSS